MVFSLFNIFFLFIQLLSFSSGDIVFSKLLKRNLDLEQKKIENILDELYDVAAIKTFGKGKPTVSISDDATIKIARYNTADNEIIIASKTVEFALTKDSLSKEHLYLQVIGHELGHCFMMAINRTFDDSSSSHRHISQLEETEADFYGVFTGMLAGHSLLKYEIKKNIASLYKLFNLQDTIYGYPPLPFRQLAAERAIQKADSLYQLFQLANCLTAVEEYDPALEIYDYLIKFYGGAEFYNNRGILNTLKGIQENYGVHQKYKRYFFPLELDMESKLTNVRTDGKVKKELDDYYFQKAKLDFQKAILIGGQQERHYLNKVVPMILSSEYAPAKDTLENACISDGEYEHLLLAIIKAMSEESEDAKVDFEHLKKSHNTQVSTLANINLKVLTGEKDTLEQVAVCTKGQHPAAEYYVSFKELYNIPKHSLLDLSSFEFGWQVVPEKGKCYTVVYNNSVSVSVQKVESHFCENTLKNYFPSSMGINYASYLFKDENDIKRKLLLFANNDQVIVSQF